MKVLVTGAGGLIGSEAVQFYAEKGANIIGIDNNMRMEFYGPEADVRPILKKISSYKNFKNYQKDIRDRKGMDTFFKKYGPFDLILHFASQPAHDWAVRAPLVDWDTNANGTMNLLEAFRLHSPEATFILTGTSKTYGDNPNKAELVELPTRYDFAENQKMPGISIDGITEEFPINNCLHSLFGASKTAGDIAAQEYGRYFNLKVGIFRGDCLTGKQHRGCELHGFLAYLVTCAVNKKPYSVFGYKCKQTRGNIHAYDCITAFDEFYKNPKPGEVYNLGGGKSNSLSMMEAINMLESKYDLKLNWKYEEKARIGDHICYYSDISKLKHDFPNWRITMPIDKIMDDLVEGKTQEAEKSKEMKP